MNSILYFASQLKDPLFELFEVYDNHDHPSRPDLLLDLEKITAEQIEQFENYSDWRFQLDPNDPNYQVERNLYILLEILNREIAKLRINLLNSTVNHRPSPYNQISLIDTEFDKNNLVKLSDFNPIRGGFLKGDQIYTLLPTTNASNSSYWLLAALSSAVKKELIRIRLDPLVFMPVKEFNPMEYRMHVYGKSLDWERVKRLQTIEHTQFIGSHPSSGDISQTDIVWKPVDNEIHLTCEEMPKKEHIEVRGSRYFHAILELNSGFVKHCDGAIRYYTEDEYNFRVTNHIKSNSVTRIGKRVKIFQIDIPKGEIKLEPLTQKALVDIISSFFVWNHDVFKYFNS